MGRRTDDFEIDPVVVPIDDGRDLSAAAMETWLASLHRAEPVTLRVSAATLVQEMRENDEA